MKEKYFKNEYAEMWLENGVIHIIHGHHVMVDIENAKINVAARLEIAGGKTYPVFVDFTKAKGSTKEARNYLSTGDGIRGISAGAFLIKTQIEAFLINAWIALYPMKVPSKLFTDKDKALEWLEQFKRIN